MPANLSWRVHARMHASRLPTKSRLQSMNGSCMYYADYNAISAMMTATDRHKATSLHCMRQDTED